MRRSHRKSTRKLPRCRVKSNRLEAVDRNVATRIERTALFNDSREDGRHDSRRSSRFQSFLTRKYSPMISSVEGTRSATKNSASNSETTNLSVLPSYVLSCVPSYDRETQRASERGEKGDVSEARRRRGEVSGKR